MSSELDAFVKRMNQVAATYEKTPTQMVTSMSRTYVNSIRSSINSVTTGGKLRGVGKNGARVGVTSKIVGGGENPTARIQATGPLHLLERDTRGGYEIPRVAKTRRSRTASGRLSHKRELTGRTTSGRSLLVINGHVVTGPVVRKHGTKGKHPFEKGVDRVEREAFASAVADVTKELSRIFRA